MVVCKFGGSSVADASQIRKVKSILESDERRSVIVVSAPGKRNKEDDKITDLLYRCNDMVRSGQSCRPVFNVIAKRFSEIAHALGVDEKELEGRMAYGGLDLSSVSDFTAVTLDFPMEDDRHVQITHCWVPESMVTAISRQCRIPLRKWIEMGWVTATPGDVIDYDYVRDYLTDAYSRYQIHYIAADRWKIEELVKLMPPWFTDVAYEFSQGMKTMSPTIMDFERTYLEGKVSDNGNECVDWMMSCAETFQDTTGNVKLVKPKRRTEARIDGVITSVMALANAKTNNMAAFAGSVEDMLTAW